MQDQSPLRQAQKAGSATGTRATLAMILLVGSLVSALTGCQSLSYPEPTAEASAVIEPTNTPEVPVVATTPASWAALSRAGRDGIRMRDLPAAEKSYVEALEASKSFRAHDARVESSLGNLLNVAASYQAGSRFEDADRVIAVVLEASTEGRGPSFGAAGLVLETQGEYLERTGADLEAIRLYEHALELKPGTGSASTGVRRQIEHRLGKAYLRQGQFDKAEPNVVAVHEALKISPGPEAMVTATALLDVANLREGLHDTAAAEAAYVEAIRIIEQAQPNSVDLAAAQNGLAWFYLERGRYLEALPPAESASRILVEHQVGGGTLAAVLDTLATAEMRVKRLDSAEAHFKQAIAARDQADPDTRRALVSILENYAELLRGTNRGDEAARIEAQIAAESQSLDSLARGGQP